MKNRKLTGGVMLGVVCAALALTMTARATPILITELNLAAFPPYGDGTDQTAINAAIGAYNLDHPMAQLPTTGIGATANIKVNTGDTAPTPYPSFSANTLSITVPAGSYNYIFLHWGGPNDDAAYKNPQLFYVGGDTGSDVFNAPLNGTQQYGLSFYSLYGPSGPSNVPDGGMTAALLGLAFCAVQVLRRTLPAV